MASLSISKEKKLAHVKVVVDGKSQRIQLGRISRRAAEPIAAKIDELEASYKLRTPRPPELREWLNKADDALISRLIALKLINAQFRHRSVTVSVLYQLFLEEKRKELQGADLHDATVGTWDRAYDNLLRFFGGDTDIRTITTEAGIDFVTWLNTHGNKRTDGPLAGDTVFKRVSICRQFFRYAVEQQLIELDPLPPKLKRIKKSSMTRVQFVSRAKVDLVLGGLVGGVSFGFSRRENQQIDLAIVLARYQALTVPSEALCLTWDQVCLHDRKLDIYKPKTDAWREMPIFQETLHPLLAAYEDRINSENDYVISEPRLREHKNWWTILKRRVLQAGIEPWPKLWQNLRVSCCIEIATDFPEFVENQWCGHTGSIARKFYLKASMEHFERAVGRGRREDKSWLTDGEEISIPEDVVLD